ncbi:hypothetical protein FACS1894188_07480 [Clostridia bacterium]|nr:hypothetical protein FACS1894188_07480 [Clostridia bacterium]
MSITTPFCPECRNKVNYSVKEKTESIELKNEIYEIVSRTAYCENCGAEIWIPEIEDANLKTLYDAYRQRHGIIPLDEIQAVPEKYSIGKKPLSLLLGWGEQTFSRYYDGDMPTNEYSERLKRFYREPAYYVEILENGKDGLKSRKAYKKSKAAVEKLLNFSEPE